MIYLASASPRRHELLRQIGVDHQVLAVPAPPGEDEPRLDNETAHQYVCRTAREKALNAVLWVRGNGMAALPILAADTTVILEDDVLGKPAGGAEARAMLARLSGRSHEVHTAVALVHGTSLYEAVSKTRVRMRALADKEIIAYCASGEPFGKAGAYGIQGRASVFIEHISGSYSGVMGLPLFETHQLLARAGLV